ncbi:MAG: hypothetical protein KIC54_02735 [Clostridium sp.]|nr:hypothetical protein [Clostridium sp.]
MIKAIIYNSSTGHTFRYAKMLSEKLDIPCYAIKDANRKFNSNDEIIYLSWVCANMITGIKKIRNKYNVKCYGVVGLYPKREENTNNLIKTNNIDKPVFYLQGGLDYNKLNWLKTKILHMVGKYLEKENNKQSTQLAKILENGADFVTEENLKEILEFLEN